MFYFLHFFKDTWSVFNLFRYITVRAAGASLTAFLLCLWLGPPMIEWLKKMKATANQEREHASSIHGFFAHKVSVPTMGGLLIVTSVTFSILLWGNLTNHFV
ncbi:MAG TPA: phospho-N-acetylmuramoyl-pentapeptide-transferase, partial [bacterium]|nr:phospho-N-acetylmuramoyl-pentapeptide-transferase [bacterium]